MLYEGHIALMWLSLTSICLLIPDAEATNHCDVHGRCGESTAIDEIGLVRLNSRSQPLVADGVTEHLFQAAASINKSKIDTLEHEKEAEILEGEKEADTFEREKETHKEEKTKDSSGQAAHAEGTALIDRMQADMLEDGVEKTTIASSDQGQNLDTALIQESEVDNDGNDRGGKRKKKKKLKAQVEVLQQQMGALEQEVQLLRSELQFSTLATGRSAGYCEEGNFCFFFCDGGRHRRLYR
eukprot:gnl/TRDRNA2_/TRDRNA2_135901_c0_seq1.p1 gnl/TRDRNA2_/TRDRNA2_135901_c0~~gnl/TRDRNA2_/TRDRNA2_135901_c0_seq1.p1  ORF type:complete len:240 (+),score=65.60 gnl/TRDRNA2_/TRDRNA2_135901_c0_seq1:70-789(+)